jgi:polyhydroxyalkanoate synthesis regulator protein
VEIITKYNNRKMYNKATKGYVTFDYIMDLVKRDVPFKVTHAETKLDVTAKIKTNILKDLYAKVISDKSWTEQELNDSLKKMITRTEGVR